MSLFSELKNRNVFRVAAAYVVSAWLLIQVVETIFPAFGFGEGAVRIVVIISAIGLIPVVVFSWLFEVTPDGLKRESEVDRSGPVAAATAGRLNRAIIIILTLATGYFAFDKFVLAPEREAELEQATTERVRTEALVASYGESSIAVLPFRNMSDDPDNEYFSDGISEELLNLLARIPRLRVISQSSSFAFKGKDISIPDVARQLSVAFILEGSVRKSAGKVRITAQLIEAQSDTHLWSETYDRTLDDIFAIQDEIGAAIVSELRGKLNLEIGEAPKVASTGSSEAHDASLRGWYLFAQRVPGSKTRAAAEFEKALALDPDFAMAHAGLAFSLTFKGCEDVSDAECASKVKHHFETALSLDPMLPEAHAAKAFWSSTQGRLDDARTHYRRALELNPNYAAVYVWMANAGLFDTPAEAFEAYEKAALLDPLSPLTNYTYIIRLISQGKLDEARKRVEHYAVIDPAGAIFLRGAIAAFRGHESEYVLAALEALSKGGGTLNFRGAIASELAMSLAGIGLESEALRMESDDQVTILSFSEDPEAAIELGKRLRSEHPDDGLLEVQLYLALAHAGHYNEARPFFETGWQEYRDYLLGSGLGWYEMQSVQSLIAMLRAAGEETKANDVLVEFTRFLRIMREAGVVEPDLDYLEGVAAWLAGDRDRGLALMAVGESNGYWIRPPAAFQLSMYQNPGFAPLLQQQSARQTHERAIVLRFACADDYPYGDVWQPMPETCQEFKATQSN